MAVCPVCGHETRERSRFCSACGTSLVQAPPRDVRKIVTVLFADVIESTSLGEKLDPEALRWVMSRYFERMQAIVERHEGQVEKFIGDAIMAVFGIPVAHEDDALRALRAAAEMRASLAELNVELQRNQGIRLEVRIGVNTGEVVAGDPSAGQRLVTGDAVNVAARLEQAASPGQVLLGEETHRLIGEGVQVKGPEVIVAKGKRDPVVAFVLVDLRRDASFPVHRLDAPLVGREHEFGALRAALERAISERSCRLVTVLGAAGVGKSRLAAELAAWAGDRAKILIGHSLPYGEGITYWPVVEALRQALGIGADESASPSYESLVELAGGDEEEARAMADRVAHVIGAHKAAAANEETFWAVRRLLEGIARKRPLVLMLEDLHWAEPTLLDLVEYIVDWSRDAPLLVICLARPELLDERPTWSRRLREEESIRLEPLNQVAADLLMDTLLGDRSLAPAARARIAEAAEGNPLFLEQMLAMIVEEGGAIDEVAVPPTIRALLTARLDRLTRGERAVIERAAVMGRVFSWEAVRELSPEEEDWSFVGEQLMALVRKELVSPEGEAGPSEHRFRFRHILIRDAAYVAIPKVTRAEFHERFAGWLERGSAEYEEVVGYHLEQAFRYRIELGPLDERASPLAARGADFLASAGRRAFARGDMPAAANLIERAAALYPNDRTERLQLLPTLGKALRETGELGPSDAVLTEALAVARAAGDRRVESLAQIERASLRDYTDSSSDLDELRRVAERSIGVFEELGDDEALAQACSLLAEVHWTRGHFAAMEEVLERALAHAERAGDERERAFILYALARAAFLGPMPVDTALRRCEQVSAQAGTDRMLAAAVLPPAGGLHALRGDFEQARFLYTSARAKFEEFGLRAALAALPLYSGPIELLAGDSHAAEHELDRGRRLLEEMGDRSRLSTTCAFLAQALYAQGRYAAADAAALAAAAATTPHDSYTQAVWRGTHARVLVRRGELEEAERVALEGAAIASQTDSPDLAGDALLVLADVLTVGSRTTEAAAHAREALRHYRAKGNKVSSRLAEELAGLTPADGGRSVTSS